MIVQELVATLGLNVDERAFRRSEQLLRDLGTGLLGFGAMAAAALAGLGELARETANSAHEVSILAQRVGVSTQALQELEYAAKLNGVDFEDLTNGLRFLNRATQEARDGTQEFALAFRRLHIDPNVNRTADQMLMEIAKHFGGLKTTAEKTQIAMQLFSRSGANLIPLLNKGADGIDELRKRAHDLGIVMDGETIQKGEEFEEQLSDLGFALRGLKYAIGEPLLQAFTSLARAMTKGVVVIQKWVKSNFGPWFQSLTKYAGQLGDELNVLKAVLYTAALAVFAFNLSIGAVSFDGILMAIAMTIGQLQALAAWALGAAAAFLPFLLLSAAIVLIWNEIYTTLNGGDSLITRISKNWDDFVSWKEGDSGIVKFLKTMADWLVKILHFLNPFEYLLRLVDQFRNSWEALRNNDFKGAAKAFQNTDVTDFFKQMQVQGPSLSYGHVTQGPQQMVGWPFTPSGPVNSSHAATQTNHIAITVPPGTDGAQIGNQVADTLEKEWDRQLSHANAAADGG